MKSSPFRFFALSNAVTYLAIGLGIAATQLSRGPRGNDIAGLLFALMAIADLLDGRFARLFARTSDEQRFGVQIDSLADAVCFGIVPVVVLGALLAQEGHPPGTGWFAAALIYVLAALTRLGFYNIAEDEMAGFVGVPTTVMGLAWSVLLLWPPRLGAVCSAMIVLAVLMVAPIPIARPRTKAIVVLVVGGLGLIGAHARALL